MHLAFLWVLLTSNTEQENAVETNNEAKHVKKY